MRNSLLNLTLLALSVGVVAGCTTVDVVRREITPTKQLVVRYVPQSNPDKEAKRRDLVNQKAREFCGGEFHITREYEALEETGGSTGVGIGTGFGYNRGFGTVFSVGTAARNTQMYRFVDIACGLAPQAAAIDPTASPAPDANGQSQPTPNGSPKANATKATPPKTLPPKKSN